jgi:hypothetical protein
MSYALTQCNADVIGFYRSAEEAMQAVPGVSTWRLDEHRMFWDGWCADALPFSPPDYQVTYLGSCEDGFTWGERVQSGAQARGAA